MNAESHLRQFATIAMTGLNLQRGQSLAIKMEPEHAEVAAFVAEEAYRRGAALVELWPESSRLLRARLDHQDGEALDRLPGWRAARNREFIDDRWALLSIKSPIDPTVMDGVDATRSSRVAQAVSRADEELRRALSNDEMQWCVMAVPTPRWAARVLHMDDEVAALAEMWRAMTPILRLDEPDPATYWKGHGVSLKRRSAALDGQHIRSLHIVDRDTDLIIPLHERAQWLGGGATTRSGVDFLPNIPTEEVFTAPYAPGVEGTVAITRPVRIWGTNVEGARFEFSCGEVVSCDAQAGLAVLQQFLDIDPGSRRMGEIALVDSSSPIAQSGLVFENILLDENATCHFALGSAYPTCITGGSTMNDRELTAVGANRSRQHVDFMFGTPHTSIVATCADGKEIPVMEEGRVLL